MSFHMPTVSIEDVSYNVACMLSEITTRDWRLRECPLHNTHDWIKMFHSVILRALYHDSRWNVPVWWAWGMPHTLTTRFEEAQKILSPIVKQMIDKNVFRDPLCHEVR